MSANVVASNGHRKPEKPFSRKADNVRTKFSQLGMESNVVVVYQKLLFRENFNCFGRESGISVKIFTK